MARALRSVPYAVTDVSFGGGMQIKKRAKWWVLLLMITAIGVSSRGCFFVGPDHHDDHWDDHR
jgi:hypothetical protein